MSFPLMGAEPDFILRSVPLSMVTGIVLNTGGKELGGSPLSKEFKAKYIPFFYGLDFTMKVRMGLRSGCPVAEKMT
ncbi:MAG: hypothetical protein MI892_02395 [Desulfobacterales bacterium]|nr:hypothetical protein [Desulfobacterales bacterium]